MYDIQFTETKAIQLASRNQILKGTVQDLEKRKKLKRIQADLEFKKRNRLTKEKQREYKKFSFDGKKVLSLDMSTTSTGWAVLTNKSILNFGSFSFLQTNKSKAEKESMRACTSSVLYEHEFDIDKRLEVMFKGISELLTTYKPDIILFEDVYLGCSVTTLKQLMKLQGFIIGYCLMNNKEHERIMPSSWQSFHQIGAKYGEDTKSASIRKAEMVLKQKVIDDIADAVNMGIYAIKTLEG
ncbi:MAG: crossover junction endodeoxyribonuclease RuvC [Fusobacteriaceae bacterium]